MKNNLEVIRNYDYTITIKDNKNKGLVFRDICGSDLEAMEFFLQGKERISFDGLIQILNYLSVNKLNFSLLPQSISIQIFNLLNEHILCNLMPKYDWLRKCFVMQNGSFANLLEMEKVPMTKFVAMMQVHQDAIEAINKE